MIDETLARRFFSGEDPVGRRIRVPWGVFEVAGVVGSVKVSALDIQGLPSLYFEAQGAGTLVIRTEQQMPKLPKVVATMVSRLDPDQPIHSVSSMDEWIAHSVKIRRFVAWMIGVFATIGTGLASLGVFNLLSYIVQTQRREIGIRMAVGASGGTIARWVCRGRSRAGDCGPRLVEPSSADGGAGCSAKPMVYGIRFADPSVWLAVLGLVWEQWVFWRAPYRLGERRA